MDPVQVATFVMILIALVILIALIIKDGEDMSVYVAILTVVIHAAIFYTFALFFRGPNISFTHWSSWLRLHEWAVIALVMGYLFYRSHLIRKIRRGL
jgi:hypothetical protein